ncbi:iron uptake system protein EfeO [Streptomyces spinosirectus]|jgi:iron uptake system component EfeO|uniref:iron uptake system protein EfeO n=1 Tax=Streptomyces TaxID=1883 RepID=UPI000D3A3C13|nr:MULTISPECIES: iron uptake system protein EfeO [Streptomyces]MBY8344528.1 iron uptake system protein EfeO [Streptomyces plumbidurans]PTM99626.1 iron uptake system component EfeO [Streptomyces sp. VMFN-G11Ma]UIR17692.1 iron uptake system protein EfeO [Streptomyces spinosirectus]
MRAARLSVVTAVATAAALTAVTGCTEKSKADGDAAIKVTAADAKCDTSAKSVPAGQVSLSIENKGSKATEVEILFPDDRIVSEKENIGPGTKYQLTAEVKAGSYEIACRPGMKGHGVRQKLTVTGSGAVAKRDPQLDKAVAAYRAYAQDQADRTIPKVETFTNAIKAGNLKAAQDAYAPSRVGWERTEPIAESFGDIDPKTDTRADGLEKGQKWTGWHALEKALWQDKKIGAAQKTLADQLVTDLKDWQKRVGKAEITPTSMANGAKELLDEVATGKVTGEEDRYSHTDLSDFKANVEGAQQAYELLKPVAQKNDKALTTELDKQFAAITTQLDKYRSDKTSDGFVSYATVTKAQRKELSDAVNALAEPLSKLAAAVVK